MTLANTLSTSYSAPLAHLCVLIKSPQTYIEAYESYQKQSFRNRMYITASSGIQMLSVPVEHLNKQPIRDTKIAYREPWARNHFRTLQTCYNSAPYFMYYCDEIQDALNTNYKYLFDLNQHLLQIICKVIHIQEPQTTSGWINSKKDEIDLRTELQDKKHIPLLTPEYPTLFDNKITNPAILSGFDLVFKLGPEGRDFLNKCELTLI